MNALKTGLVIIGLAFFSFACSTTETPNANQSANHNAAPTAANSNQAAGAPAMPATTPGEAKPENINASEIFVEQKCVGCHNADGKGKLKGTPDFTDAAWQKQHTDEQFIETIKNGDKPMPAYGSKLTDGQIKALVAYVRSFAK